MTTLTQANLATMSQAELIALVTTMAAQPAKRLSFKVTDKGGLSVYGMGRWPTTLYVSQWERLLADDNLVALKAFIETNRKLLAIKE